jgi:hypothetical protein
MSQKSCQQLTVEVFGFCYINRQNMSKKITILESFYLNVKKVTITLHMHAHFCVLLFLLKP